MSSESSDNATIRRRRFILEKLQKEGQVTYEEIQDQGKESSDSNGGFPVSHTSVGLDVAYLEQLLRIRIQSVKAGGRLSYVNGDEPTMAAKEARASLYADSKLAMAWLAGSLTLCGPTLQGNNRFTVGNRKSEKWKAHLVEPSYIREQLKDFPRLLDKVETFWSQITRRVCVDTGTTMDTLCSEVLSHVKLPSPDTILNYLEICTNSRSIFNMLGDSRINPRALIIGGTQEVRTEAVCGRLAEVCLENWGLNFGIAFVGATVVDLTRKHLGSDHLRISVLKAMMLERAAIKVVVADFSKMMTEPLRADYPYTALKPETIDILITDRTISPKWKESDVASERRQWMLWEKLRETGVAILAVPKETLEAAGRELEERRKRK